MAVGIFVAQRPSAGRRFSKPSAWAEGEDIRSRAPTRRTSEGYMPIKKHNGVNPWNGGEQRFFRHLPVGFFVALFMRRERRYPKQSAFGAQLWRVEALRHLEDPLQVKGSEMFSSFTCRVLSGLANSPLGGRPVKGDKKARKARDCHVARFLAKTRRR